MSVRVELYRDGAYWRTFSTNGIPPVGSRLIAGYPGMQWSFLVKDIIHYYGENIEHDPRHFQTYWVKIFLVDGTGIGSD